MQLFFFWGNNCGSGARSDVGWEMGLLPIGLCCGIIIGAMGIGIFFAFYLGTELPLAAILTICIVGIPAVVIIVCWIAWIVT